MPLTAAAATALAAGIGAASGGISAFSQANLNKKNRRWSEEMYARQRKDAVEFWNMENQYNSPQEQMKRFQEAGLNPMLMYGQGSSGQAGSVSMPETPTPQTQAPDWGAGIGQGGRQGLEMYYDVQMKDAALKVSEKQQTIMDQDALLRAAQIVQTVAQTKGIEFDTHMKQRLEDISIQAAELANKQAATNIDLSLQRNAREAAMTSSNLNEAMWRMHTMSAGLAMSDAQRRKTEQEIRNLQKDGKLKQLDINLRKAGINPNDPMYQRVIGKLLSSWFNEDGTLNFNAVDASKKAMERGMAPHVYDIWKLLPFK